MTHFTRCILIGAIAVATVTCSERPAVGLSGSTGGTLVVGVRAAPERIHPAQVSSTTERLLVDVLYERLARLGPDLDPVNEAGFTKELATSWQWGPDSSTVTFKLDPAERWHDGVPVRAVDVAFGFAFMTDPLAASPSRADLAGVDSVVADDSLTVTAWFNTRSPFRFHDLVMGLIPIPAHIWAERPRQGSMNDQLMREPVGNGRFRFSGPFNAQEVVLLADSTHPRGRPVVDRLVVRASPDPATMLARLRTGEVDIVDQLPVTALRAISTDTNLVVVTTDAFDYSFLLFNLFDGGSDRPHPVLGDPRVRHALARATDRTVLIRAVYDSFAVVANGPFVDRQFGALTDVAATDRDSAMAAAMLDSAGWVLTTTGMRARRGVPLRVDIVVPSSSAARVQMAEILQEQWRSLGVELRIDPAEPAALGARMERRDFTMALATIHTSATPAGLRQSWGEAGTGPKGRNVGRYRSATFEAHVDSAFTARSAAEARDQFAKAYRVLLADAPAVFLYQSKTVVALNRRVHTTSVRGDAWWFDLSAWGLHPSTAAR